MQAALTRPRGSLPLAMTFVDTYAKQLQLPHTVLRRATVAVLELICRYAPPSDTATMFAAMPDLAGLHEHNTSDSNERPGPLARLKLTLQRATHTARATRQALQATGLGTEDVTFISALALYMSQHLGEELTQRLLHCVPGLQAMTSWPLTPYREELDPPTMP